VSGIAAQVEACFRESIKVAERQKAKSWELRTLVSMARYNKERYGPEETSKSIEILSRLAEIYGGFSEGLDTADLREARDLLKGSEVL
jgi:adenylate cyclase